MPSSQTASVFIPPQHERHAKERMATSDQTNSRKFQGESRHGRGERPDGALNRVGLLFVCCTWEARGGCVILAGRKITALLCCVTGSGKERERHSMCVSGRRPVSCRCWHCLCCWGPFQQCLLRPFQYARLMGLVQLIWTALCSCVGCVGRAKVPMTRRRAPQSHGLTSDTLCAERGTFEMEGEVAPLGPLFEGCPWGLSLGS